MKITEDVRGYAAEQGVSEEGAIKKGLEEKAARVHRKRLRSLREGVNRNAKQARHIS